jgi:glycosyltransferase involved in cell wall biosynthesis
MFHANIAGRLLRLVMAAPVVISTLHSMAESGRHSKNVRWRDLLYRITDGLADATVAVCTAAAERHAKAKAVCPCKLHVIPNGVDTAAFARDPAVRQSMRRQFGLDGEFTWLAVGRLMWKKDYPTMLQAFSTVRGGVLLIAGAGPQEKELAKLPNVRFLGPRRDIAELMSCADAFVLSSVVEGLPVALLEAAASGLPAVATNVGGVHEAIVEGRTGFIVPPGDPAAIAQAMRRVMEMSSQEREAMGQAAAAYARQNFDWTVVMERWERLYDELLEREAAANRERTL